MQPKIFISHSAHRGADDRIMAQLINSLKAEGFNVFCDRKDLQVGDQWREKLYSEIGSCHAAVVLITKNALDVENYPWVFAECSMFTFINRANRSTNPFPIFPIRMTDVTVNDVEDSPFKMLQINEIMAGSHENLNSIVDIIKCKLCGKECLNKIEPLYYHQRRIANRLKQVGSRSIIEAIDQIGLELNHWHSLAKENPYMLARILLSLNADQVIGALPHALQGILIALGIEESLRLIYFLAPFWFDLPDATRINQIIQEDQNCVQKRLANSGQSADSPRMAFGLNALDELVARLCVSKAGYLRELPYRIIMPPTDGGPDDVGRYAKHIKEEIFGRRNNKSDEAMNRVATERPIIVIVSHDTAQEDVQKLRSRFWAFIFVILAGQSPRDKWELPDFLMLEPLLVEGIEDQACKLVDTAIVDVNTIVEGH